METEFTTTCSENNDLYITVPNTDNTDIATSGYIHVDSESADISLITDDSEFINDENYDAFRLLNLKSKFDDINALRDQINEQPNRFINNNNDDIDFIDKNIENVTEDDIKAMSPDEIDKLLIDEDGNPVEFIIDFSDVGIAKFNEFKKDFLIMRKQSLDTITKFDEEIKVINAEIAESQEEFDKLVNNIGNVTNLIRSTLVKRLEEADTDEKKELFNKMIISFDNGMNLDNIKSYCKSHKGKDIIWDHKNEKKTYYIYRRYLKVINSLNIKTDLTTFNMLEKRFLPEEYQERPNIFVFSVIHYISSMHNKDYSKIDGLFLTQFMINLKNLYYNKFDNEEDREKFISNIKDVIKIIG